jgi:hypothetical protein
VVAKKMVVKRDSFPTLSVGIINVLGSRPKCLSRILAHARCNIATKFSKRVDVSIILAESVLQKSGLQGDEYYTWVERFFAAKMCKKREKPMLMRKNKGRADSAVLTR